MASFPRQSANLSTRVSPFCHERRGLRPKIGDADLGQYVVDEVDMRCAIQTMSSTHEAPKVACTVSWVCMGEVHAHRCKAFGGDGYGFPDPAIGREREMLAAIAQEPDDDLAQELLRS